MKYYLVKSVAKAHVILGHFYIEGTPYNCTEHQQLLSSTYIKIFLNEQHQAKNLSQEILCTDDKDIDRKSTIISVISETDLYERMKTTCLLTYCLELLFSVLMMESDLTALNFNSSLQERTKQWPFCLQFVK